MDCATEESEIRRALEPIEGIHTLRFQLSERTLSMTGTPSAVELAQAAIRRAGFDPQLIQPDAAGTALTAEASGFFRGGVKRLIAALILATMAEAIGFIEAQSLVAQGLEIALAMAAIGLAGLDTYKKGLMALRHAKLNINALMTVAVTGAFLIGQWPEAAMVMALYAIAELIEARSVDRARNAIKGLMALAPEEADVQQADGTWRTLKASEVPLAAIVRIRPGARVPLDGVVTAGNSAVNQAPVTGESIPVDKAMGDTVFAGTINETGELQFRVTAEATNTTLAGMIHAVEEAQGGRAPTLLCVATFAAI